MASNSVASAPFGSSSTPLSTQALASLSAAGGALQMVAAISLSTASSWSGVTIRAMSPVADAFVEAAFTDGKLPVPSIPVEWAPPRFESVNPLQDATTDLLEVRAGFVSPQQAIAKRGYDPKAVLAEWTEFAALVDAGKMVFDSDPRYVSKGGQAQAVGSFDDDTGEPKDDQSGGGDDTSKPDAATEGTKP